MTIKSAEEFDEFRRALSGKLRAVRSESGVSGPELAVRLGVSQSKISKIETGRTTPSVNDVERIAKALGASREVRADLVAHARELHVEYNSWRHLLRGGLSLHQAEILQIEATASLFRIFQQALVPGLLQTADYARNLFKVEPVFPEQGDVGKAVAMRLERQSVLYDTNKNFSFLMTEFALRARYCSPSAMAAQIDRVLSVATLPNVEIGVIPTDAPLSVVPHTSIVIFDDQLVIVETFSAELDIHGKAEIAIHERMFDAVRSDAIFGAKAKRLLTSIRDDFMGVSGKRR